MSEILITTINNEPWFVAADVCRALEIGNPTMALSRLDEDEKDLISIEGISRGNNQANVVNEYGLYDLILGSRKPEAKAFKRWITHEVIPSIRKHGAYATEVTIDNEPWFVAADVCRALDLSNPTVAMERLDEDERTKFNLGRQGEGTIINEPGLYSLILGSRKPEAKTFKRWITHEVIPSIRKHGAYATEVTIDNEPWFVGKDVADILGYENATKAVRDHVDLEDRKMGVQNVTPSITDTLGREQYPTWINESGLYSLILSSKLPSAKRFKRWVTSEVLPSIRKYGAYATPVTIRDSIGRERKNPNPK